jgi:hypothetical protein
MSKSDITNPNPHTELPEIESPQPLWKTVQHLPYEPGLDLPAGKKVGVRTGSAAQDILKAVSFVIETRQVPDVHPQVGRWSLQWDTSDQKAHTFDQYSCIASSQTDVQKGRADQSNKSMYFRSIPFL